MTGDRVDVHIMTSSLGLLVESRRELVFGKPTGRMQMSKDPNSRSGREKREEKRGDAKDAVSGKRTEEELLRKVLLYVRSGSSVQFGIVNIRQTAA